LNEASCLTKLDSNLPYSPLFPQFKQHESQVKTIDDKPVCHLENHKNNFCTQDVAGYANHCAIDETPLFKAASREIIQNC
jgi:hypothetical protein